MTARPKRLFVFGGVPKVLDYGMPPYSVIQETSEWDVRGPECDTPELAIEAWNERVREINWRWARAPESPAEADS
jgi:hypothetical protein